MTNYFVMQQTGDVETVFSVCLFRR